MKKAIIFILCMSGCIAGSVPQAKKIIPRRYDAEATQKLQDKMNEVITLIQESKGKRRTRIQTPVLNELKALILDADTNVTTKLQGIEHTLSAFLIEIIPMYIEESDYQLLEDIIETSLRRGMKMMIGFGDGIRPNYFINTMRMITRESPDAIKTILYLVENPQQREQNLSEIKKVLQEDVDLEQAQIQHIKQEADRSRKILEALEKESAKPAVVNIK